MANPIDDLRTFQTAVIQAEALGDYATALRNYDACETLVSLFPDLERSSGTGGGSQKMSWTRQWIAEKRLALIHKLNASLGIQSSDIVFSNPVDY